MLIYIYIYVNRYIHARLKHTQYIIYTKSNISSFTSNNRHLRPPTVTNRELTVQWLIFDFFCKPRRREQIDPGSMCNNTCIYIYMCADIRM